MVRQTSRIQFVENPRIIILLGICRKSGTGSLAKIHHRGSVGIITQNNEFLLTAAQLLPKTRISTLILYLWQSSAFPKKGTPLELIRRGELDY